MAEASKSQKVREMIASYAVGRQFTSDIVCSDLGWNYTDASLVCSSLNHLKKRIENSVKIVRKEGKYFIWEKVGDFDTSKMRAHKAPTYKDKTIVLRSRKPISEVDSPGFIQEVIRRRDEARRLITSILDQLS